MTPDAGTACATNRNTTRINLLFFSGLLLLLIAAAIIRSAIATRLDGFTIDEAYHIAAGVSYVRLGEFRINPEHPPLVKLWVGSFIALTGFRGSALRRFSDKQDERTFENTRELEWFVKAKIGYADGFQAKTKAFIARNLDPKMTFISTTTRTPCRGVHGSRCSP